jgi:hypothetical protein
MNKLSAVSLLAVLTVGGSLTPSDSNAQSWYTGYCEQVYIERGATCLSQAVQWPCAVLPPFLDTPRSRAWRM